MIYLWLMFVFDMFVIESKNSVLVLVLKDEFSCFVLL